MLCPVVLVSRQRIEADQNAVGFNEMDIIGLDQSVNFTFGHVRQDGRDARRRHFGHAFARRAEIFEPLVKAAVCHGFAHLNLDLGLLRHYVFLVSHAIRVYNWLEIRTIHADNSSQPYPRRIGQPSSWIRSDKVLTLF